MRTLILSDIHLGNRHCQTALLNEVLDRESFDRLILNGDTLNSLNLRKLNGAHWGLLDRFRKLGRERELILIRGNHDHEADHVPHHLAHGRGRDDGPDRSAGNDIVQDNAEPIGTADVLPGLLEIPMREDYRLNVDGNAYLVLHGDRFDPTLSYPMVTEVACLCYQFTTKLNKKVAKWLKKKSKRWGGVLEFVRGRSVAHAQDQGVHGVITGHTHFAEDSRIDNVHYVNTGCWTEYPCSYVAIAGGRISLNHPVE
jgi:UDP-2,3-diacylglucosamine pyrophosphatase LpxH